VRALVHKLQPYKVVFLTGTGALLDANKQPISAINLATDYDDLVRLGAVGAAREGQLGAQLAEDVARFEFAQREPGQRVTQYLAAVGGGGGGTTQRSLDPYTPANPLLGLLGGAATGAAMIPTGYTGSIAPFIGGGAALGGLSAFV